MQRKDITDQQVCLAYERKSQQDPGGPVLFADEVLISMTGAPEKVAYAAMDRASDRGLIEFGVTLRSGWLTDKGQQLIG